MEKQLEIVLQRVRSTRYGLDGALYIDNVKVCDTVENADSCIKEGEYKIALEYCKHHKRKMPVIKLESTACNVCILHREVFNNTPMPCHCPQITMGNGMHNRHDGAIIVGEALCAGVLIHTRKAFDSTFNRILMHIKRKHEILLMVKGK
jgi:hypothetical protein